jgi:Spy/CpxP family protein refolding chaperone
MKNTKIFLTLIYSVIIFISSTATAQNRDQQKKTPEERATKMSEILEKKLQLTDMQKSSVYNIFLSQAQQVDKIRTNSTSDRCQKCSELKAAREQTDSQLKSILTSEQYSKLTTLKQERIEKRKQKRQLKKDKK